MYMIVLSCWEVFMEKINELTKEEQAKSYAKYYYLKAAEPDVEILSHCKGSLEIESSKALKLEEINNLLNKGYHQAEIGYCDLEEGGSYISIYTKMPGVTVDMINWWFAWHPLEDLRYKIWWPKGHYKVSVNEMDRKKILDPNVHITNKIYGVTHYITEDIGLGNAEEIELKFISPVEFGFDMNRFRSPNVGTIIGALGKGKGEKNFGSVMLHFVREKNDGVEVRSRFWGGWTIENKKPKLVSPKEIKVPEILKKTLLFHNVYEYANLRAILPKIYFEEYGKIE